MEKTATVTTTIFSLLIITFSMPKSCDSKNEEASWFQDLGNIGREKVARLHFFVHDFLDGPNKSLYEVARASIVPPSPTKFGQIQVMDELLTAEPDMNSEKVGRLQGLITSSDFKDRTLSMNLNFVFTSGKYNGSTLSYLGRNQSAKETRELAIVGGTGVFRTARGYAILDTYSIAPDYLILEYKLYIMYMDL